jgi:hypothetical protein
LPADLFLDLGGHGTELVVHLIQEPADPGLLEPDAQGIVDQR